MIPVRHRLETSRYVGVLFPVLGVVIAGFLRVVGDDLPQSADCGLTPRPSAALPGR